MQAIQAEALEARAAGEHERAIGLWRTLLQAQPSDWRLALELKHDLKAALHYPDSDKLFRRAARTLPDEAWLAHYTALYAYHGEDLDIIDMRARAMLERMPGDHRLLAILGDVASQRRDWAGAEAAFGVAQMAGRRADYKYKRELAAMYRRLGPVLAEAAAGPAYSIAFINLDRNPDREAELRRQFAGSVPALHRFSGVEGGRLNASAVRRLGGEPQMRGTLGCFLSHAGAWEAMLVRGDAYCLFVEDDVIPLLDLPATLGAFPVPAGFDLLFVNDRISPKRDPAGVHGFRILSLEDALQEFPPEDNAPGGDGYILSRDGAHKLLGWLQEDGFSDDVDWRLIAYGLSRPAIAGLQRPSHAGPWLDRVSQVVRRPERLAGYVLHPPLIRTVGVSSDREDENRLHPSA